MNEHMTSTIMIKKTGKHKGTMEYNKKKRSKQTKKKRKEGKSKWKKDIIIV